jgi:hypothetical protein
MFRRWIASGALSSRMVKCRLTLNTVSTQSSASTSATTKKATTKLCCATTERRRHYIWTGLGVVPVARLLKDEIRVPYDGSQVWRTDGSAGIQATYSCLGSPLGQFDAPIGSLAVRRDGGIASTLYVKEAVPSAGWSAK